MVSFENFKNYITEKDNVEFLLRIATIISGIPYVKDPFVEAEI